MSEWKEVTLNDITQLVIDYRGKTPLKLGGNWSDHGYRALSAKNVKTGIIVAEESIRYVDEDLYKKWMKDEVQRGDILITSEAPFGEVFYWNSDEKIVLSQRLFDVRVKRDVCAQYVYYYMTSYPFQAELRSRASGTTVLGLKQPELLKAKVVLPDYETQQKIAAQLSEIDDKIAINRRICENLEAQAQALFKHWFIDFAPFKDGKFVDSELGMIPEGWRVGTLGDIADVVMGQSPSGSSYNENGEGTIFYQGRTEFGFRFPGIRLYTTEPKRFAEPLSTLLSVRAPVGDINVATERCCIGRGLASIKSNCSLHSYIYYLLLSLKRRFEVFNGEGTVFGSINKDNLNGLSIVMPPISLTNEFDEIAKAMDNKILEAHQENLCLSALRDALLPKLMSGQIKL